MKNSYDAIVVGAGILGTSCAFQLAKHGLKKVLILEKEGAVAQGSTGFSSAVLRTRYSFDNTVRLAKEGLDAFLIWSEFLGLKETKGQVVQGGVLWMMNEGKAQIDAEVARLKQFGIACALLDRKSFQERFPSFSGCQRFFDLSGATEHSCEENDESSYFYEEKGGYADPVAANEDFLQAALALGCEIRFRSKVISISSLGGRFTSVTTDQNETYSAPCLINAAGAWCNGLNQLAGIPSGWTLEPTRIQVVLRDTPCDFQRALPVFADGASGIYGRAEARGQQILVGSILSEDEAEAVANPDSFDTAVDPEFRNLKLIALQHRIPTCRTRSNERGYAALYTINREDMHPIVGESALKGFFFVNGCSGHGFKLAPSLGSLLAQAVTGQKIAGDSAVDPLFLSPARMPLRLTSKSVLA